MYGIGLKSIHIYTTYISYLKSLPEAWEVLDIFKLPILFMKFSTSLWKIDQTHHFVQKCYSCTISIPAPHCMEMSFINLLILVKPMVLSNVDTSE